jgi:CrcB protein
MLARILWVALGGASGAVARFLLTSWIAGRTQGRFPWGTFWVNVAGCLAMGVVIHLGLRTGHISETARIGLAAGLLGGFTTFSAFSWETWDLARTDGWIHAAVYAGASLVVCVLAFAAGAAAARAAFGDAA